MTSAPSNHGPTGGIEVAVFDRNELVMTKACRGLGEARAAMRHLGADGYRCLIVSPALRNTLTGNSRLA